MEYEDEIQTKRGVWRNLQLRLMPVRLRLASSAANAERRYLSLLRYAMLAIATVVLLVAIALFAWGGITQIGPTKVDASSVAVTADDVSPPRQDTASDAPATDRAQAPLSVDAAIRSRTVAVYRKAFKPYERSGKTIADSELIGIVWPQERIKQFADLSDPLLSDAKDQPLTDSKSIGFEALDVVDQSAATESFKQTLSAYRDAKQTRVCTDQFKSRSRTVRSWDPYAMSCPGWYESPVGCASQQTIEEPYVENVCEMKFPENLDTPAQALGNALSRYANIARTKAAQSRIAASDASAQRMARKLVGRDNLRSAVWLFGGFLAVMLLYLLVALERHHRLLRQLLPRPTEDQAS